MYPRNATSPPRIAVGPVVQISDGAVQTSGVSIAVVPQDGASGAGGGTTAYDNGIVLYTPTQAETNYIAFIVTAYKTGCIPVSQTIVTTASAVSGHAGLDWATINAPTTTQNLSGTSTKALEPTVAGRTLDVSAGGEAGLDWANVGSPSSTVSLSATTVATASAVTTVNGLAAGVITASSIAADAITAAKIADGAIDAATFAAGAINAAAIAADAITDAKVASDVTIASVTGAVGSVTGNVGGKVTGSVGSVATGGISSASFATGAINAAAIATDAIADTKITVGAAQKVSYYVWREDITAHVGVADSAAFYLEGVASAVDVLPDAVWDEAISGHLTAGTTGAALNGATAPSAAAVADAVWDEALSGHLSAGTTGEALNAAGAAGDPWVTALPGAYGAGSAGYIVGTNLNATVSSRASQTSLDAVDDYIDTEVAAIKAKTDQLTFSTANRVDSQVFGVENNALSAAALAADAGTEIADAVLARDIGSGSNAGTLNERTVRSALRAIRNKWDVLGGVHTVTKEDDSTTAWTAALTSSASADPVTGSDPA